MSTFAPLQFLKSAQNPLVWTAVDNGTDTRTSLIIYYGAVNTLPADTGMYEVNCIMMHQAEKQLYANVGTPTTPNWQAFGPGSAFPQPLVPGTFLFTDGATVYWATSLVGQVQYNASNLNTYGILNFNDLLVASNDVPNSRINVDLDVVSLASNTTFINSLLANNTFISGISTALLALSSFITNLITTLLANTTFISGITNIVNTSTSTSINLTTQVTGTLGLGNGGTGSSLTDPNYDAVWVWDDTTNTTRLANISGLTYNSGTNTLTASGGGTGTALETTISQTGHGLSVGDVIKVSGTNTFAKAQGDSEVNSEAVGIVTTVVNANSFKYVSSAIQLAIAPVGTPGSAVWLDPTVAGGMTTTKPSTVGQVARALGTIIESGVTMYFDIAALAEVIGSGSGTGSFVQSGVSQKIGINITSPDPTNAFIRTMKFGNDLVLLTRGTNASGNFKVRVYSRNSDGGYTETIIADIPTAGGGAGVNAVSISKALDNSKLYVSKVGRSLGGGIQPVPMDITIDEYDSSYSLVTSYTGQTPNSLYDSDISSGFFVNGSSLYISLDNFRPATVPKHWNRWTIAGTSLTTVTDTNLIKGDDYPAFTDGTNAWFSGTNAVDHFTYSGVTFTLVGTSVLPTTTIGVNLTTASSTDAYQGVEIVSSGTKIGWFLNTSRTMLEFGSSTTLMDYMYEYNVYPF